MEVLEWIATFFGIACVFLQTKGKIIAWPFGIISVGILAYIFLHTRLYSDCILHIIFLILNIYGWWYWFSRRDHLSTSKLDIKKISIAYLIIGIVVITMGTGIWGYIMDTSTDADYAYIDAFTTMGSLVAQFWLAKKIIENWILWIIVDVVAITVYTLKDLHVVAFLFFVYLILCVYGYYNWRRMSIGAKV